MMEGETEGPDMPLLRNVGRDVCRVHRMRGVGKGLCRRRTGQWSPLGQGWMEVCQKHRDGFEVSSLPIGTAGPCVSRISYQNKTQGVTSALEPLFDGGHGPTTSRTAVYDPQNLPIPSYLSIIVLLDVGDELIENLGDALVWRPSLKGRYAMCPQKSQVGLDRLSDMRGAEWLIRKLEEARPRPW